LTHGKAVYAWCQNQPVTEVTINGLRCTRSRAPLLVASKRYLQLLEVDAPNQASPKTDIFRFESRIGKKTD